ncbi:MAG: hypothetical protein K0U41_05070 [Gammaproteobacteria bacterium]|nr:hypothetical protein [Gammaproteobacteria bacterium]
MTRPTDLTTAIPTKINRTQDNLSTVFANNMTDIKASQLLLQLWNDYQAGLITPDNDPLTNPGGIIGQNDGIDNFAQVCTVQGDDQIPDSSTAAEIVLTCSGGTPSSNVAGAFQLNGTITLETSVRAIWNGAYRLINDANETVASGTATAVKPDELLSTAEYTIEETDWDFGTERIRLAVTPGQGGSQLSAGGINRMFFNGVISRGRRGAEAVSYTELPARYDGTPGSSVRTNRVLLPYSGNMIPRAPVLTPAPNYDENFVLYLYMRSWNEYSLNLGLFDIVGTFPESSSRPSTATLRVAGETVVFPVNQGVAPYIGLRLTYTNQGGGRYSYTMDGYAINFQNLYQTAAEFLASFSITGDRGANFDQDTPDFSFTRNGVGTPTSVYSYTPTIATGNNGPIIYYMSLTQTTTETARSGFRQL